MEGIEWREREKGSSVVEILKLYPSLFVLLASTIRAVLSVPKSVIGYGA